MCSHCASYAAPCDPESASDRRGEDSTWHHDACDAFFPKECRRPWAMRSIRLMSSRAERLWPHPPQPQPRARGRRRKPGLIGGSTADSRELVEGRVPGDRPEGIEAGTFFADPAYRLREDVRPGDTGAWHSTPPLRRRHHVCRTGPRPREPARDGARRSARPRARRRSGSHAGTHWGRCRAARIGSNLTPQNIGMS
jgi:hypothetical protein